MAQATPILLSRAVLLRMSTSSWSIAESQIGKDAKQLSQAVEFLKNCDTESKRHLMETVDVVLTVTGASQIKVACPRILLGMGWEPKNSMQPNGVKHCSVSVDGLVDWDLKLYQLSVKNGSNMNRLKKFGKKGEKKSSSSGSNTNRTKKFGNKGKKKSSSSGSNMNRTKKFGKIGKFARSVSVMKKVQKFKKNALGKKKKMRFMMKKMKFMMKRVGSK